MDVAFPGDILGIHNPGLSDGSGCFAIGDTLYTGSTRIAFPGIPAFSPEVFRFVQNVNPSDYKKFRKVLHCM